MNEIKIFENSTFGKVRTVELNGEPYFAGRDVAKALGYSNVHDALNKHVDKEDKGGSKMRHPWRNARYNGNKRKRCVFTGVQQQAAESERV